MSTSSSATKTALRGYNNIYLIGSVQNQIIGSKLPSNRQVISVLFYNLREVKLNLRDSAKLVIKETVIFWEKARIHIREQHHCISKLEALYQEWRNLQKLSKRTSETQKNKVSDFIDKLDDLFDISHANVLNMIQNEEDKKFLLLQRQKGRPGCMLGTDYKLAVKEKKIIQKLEKLEQQKKREHSETNELCIGK